MNKISRMRRSRDRWKSKATDRAEQLREFRKTKARQQRKIEHLQARVNALEEQRSQEKKAHFPRD
jgi:predicted nuclease with TOPRIM domain